MKETERSGVLLDGRANARAITLHVKSEDPQVKAHREEIITLVRSYFEHNFRIPEETRAICFFDDEDFADLKEEVGASNRGIHWPIRGKGIRDVWPHYMWNIIAPLDANSGRLSWPYHSVIYLHGSTCGTDIGLTLTFAHELQHFLQYGNERQLWAANLLLGSLPNRPNEDPRVWWDLPAEKEARIIAKRVAESIYGGEAVRSHIVRMIEGSTSKIDEQDWESVQAINALDSYQLPSETRLLVGKHKLQLLQLQAEPYWRSDPDI